MPYKYKLPSNPPREQRKMRNEPIPEEEGLTGYVQGRQASELEERYAKALDKNDNVRGYDFQFIVTPPTQIPGQSNLIDFMIDAGLRYPVEVDGDWVHKTAAQKDKDAQRDAILDEYLKRFNIEPITRIEGWKLEAQEDADRVVRGQF